MLVNSSSRVGTRDSVNFYPFRIRDRNTLNGTEVLRFETTAFVDLTIYRYFLTVRRVNKM